MTGKEKSTFVGASEENNDKTKEATLLKNQDNKDVAIEEHNNEANQGTTITQVGVSGKKITSVVKKIRVVKKAQSKSDEELQEQSGAETVVSLGETTDSTVLSQNIDDKGETKKQSEDTKEASAKSVTQKSENADTKKSTDEKATAKSVESAGKNKATTNKSQGAAKSSKPSRSKSVKLDDDVEKRILAQLNGDNVPVKVKSGTKVREEQEEAVKRQAEEERRKLVARQEEEKRKREQEMKRLEELEKQRAEEKLRQAEEEKALLEKQKEERMKRLSAEVSGPVKIGNIKDLQKTKSSEENVDNIELNSGNKIDQQGERVKNSKHKSTPSKAAIEATKALENQHRAKNESKDHKSDEKTKSSNPSSDNVAQSRDSGNTLEERLGLSPNPLRKIGKIGKIQDGRNPFAATAEAMKKKNTRDDKKERGDRQKGDKNFRKSNKDGGNRTPKFQAAIFDKDADEDKQKFKSQARNSRKKSGAMDEFLQEIGAKENTRNFQTRTQFERNRRNENNKQQTQSKSRSLSRDNRGRNNYMNGDMDDDAYIRRSSRRKNKGNNLSSDQSAKLAQVSHVSLPSHLTVKEFAEAIKKTSAEVIMKLMGLGMMATVNQDIDYDTAALIAGEFDIEADPIIETSEEDILFDDSEDNEEKLTERPPVVVVMGHVDHGKTSLLDYIRNTKVTAGEAGGITQAIGAYRVEVNERQITFLDTPGHEAFTAMRARGAQATDIAILVVAADDGVMPQTIEAINHAKAAGTEIIVAINKMDKPGANPERVRQELVTYDLIPDEWGGTTTMVPISAKTGEGIDDLLEMVILTADAMELKADPERQAKGYILEAKLDPQRGSVASLLVQRGTLRKGDTIVTSHIVGNIRAMVDENGREIEAAGPSTPVEILGLPEVPEAGEIFYQVKDERLAKQLADKRRIQAREESLSKGLRTTLDNFYEQISSGEVKDLNIIVKADVVGSVEAMKQSLLKLSNDEVKVKIVHGAAGGINESDVRLAEVTNAIIIGFNVRTTGNASQLAKDSGVDIRLYRVIYNALEDIEAALKGMLDPEFVEEVTGHIEIREIFHVSSVGTIGGGYVTDGQVERNSDIRLVRDGVVIMEGKLASLRRFKDDVKEVREGFECGMSIERYNDIKVGDVVEAFRMVEVKDRQ